MPVGCAAVSSPAPLCAVLCAPLVLLAVLPEAGSPAVFHGCSISSVIAPAKSRITAKLAATKPANEVFFFLRGGWPRRGGVDVYKRQALGNGIF